MKSYSEQVLLEYASCVGDCVSKTRSVDGHPKKSPSQRTTRLAPVQNRGAGGAGRRRRLKSKQPQLNLLPEDFGWQLLTRLFDSLSVGLPDEFTDEFRSVLRKRSAADYHDLREHWGLQSINSDATRRLSVQALRRVMLLVSFAKKDPAMCSVPAERRRSECLAGVKELDRTLSEHPPLNKGDPVVIEWSRVIGEILGAPPDLATIADSAKHGPGTAVGLSFGQSSRYFKYSEWPYTVTDRARLLHEQVIRLDPRWLGALEDSYRRRRKVTAWSILDQQLFWDSLYRVVPGNRVTCVPKDGTKDRPIAIEPVANVYLQLAFDGLIRARLRCAGLDLDRQDPNQVLAQLGSKKDTPNWPATLDLSNASDTVSRTLVELLLPPEWFRMLDSLRSPCGDFPDKTQIAYCKMSSMGNGYTFVLESLLFFSLARAISRCYGQPRRDWRFIRAYGDDIIIPAYLADTLCIYLRDAGFIVNKKKSFVSGPVRESCGADFFSGENIRPVFGSTPRTIGELIGLRNRLHRWYVTSLGTSIDVTVDSWLLSYYRGEIFLGPENDCESDSWIHCPEGQDTVGPCLMARTPKIPGEEFLFRKLMHTLRACDGPGGAFVITQRDAVRTHVAVRTLAYRPYKGPDGEVQDFPRPNWCPELGRSDSTVMVPVLLSEILPTGSV